MKKSPLLIGLFVFLIVASFVTNCIRERGNHVDSITHPPKEATSTVSAPSQTGPPPVVQQGIADRVERTRALLNEGNRVITFWGKVTDEDGGAIPGVIIKYRIQRAGRLQANGTIAEDALQATTTSNLAGLFSITNASGSTLSVVDFSKEGYQLSANQKSVFGYHGTPALHTPQEKSPQVFIMRSNTKPMDVSSVIQQLRLPWDGKSIRIDLDNCSPSPSGKLILTASRTAPTGRFGWSLNLAIDGGELAESVPGSTYIAPESGYVRAWQCGYASNAYPWRFGHDANVYYKLNGKVGRLKLQIYADAGPTDVSIHLERFVNNSGGRNTEGQQ